MNPIFVAFILLAPFAAASALEQEMTVNFDFTCENVGQMITSLDSKINSLVNPIRLTIPSQIATLSSQISQIKNEIFRKSTPLPKPHPSSDNTCQLEEYGYTESGITSALPYLQRIDFNLFLNKPTNTSSEYNRNYTSIYGHDGDFRNSYSSKKEYNPWFLIDLNGPYLIWQINFLTYEYKEELSTGIKIYMANEVHWQNGAPIASQMSLFAHYTGGPSLNVQFTHPGGMCGRYVLITREKPGNTYLSFIELQAVGIALK